jgi:hypothetical protein
MANVVGDNSRIEKDTASLDWDPSDQRSHAHMAEDPEDTPKRTDPAANALAFIGLGLLPAIPTPQGLTAMGWKSNSSWSWPIWEPLLTLPVVASLLACEVLQREHPDPVPLAAQGVREVLRCNRINPTKKRPFFSPSIPV